MKPIVNQETCIGCGTCEGICPEVFKLANSKAQVQQLDDYTPFKDKIDQAVSACPVTAISLN